ncbi:MAG TPA: YkoF family thiamine/hydroxymethylpyrimidine-binding protein [Steroidobacteraceae bacterium]|nr:YkoF family thiamine/hydroxymethylpyrimidine-binding protein [Steroidobacteraceae bacterium]
MGAMDVAVEISLYPLQQDYLPVIRSFIARLNAQQRLRVETSSLSTQIVGEYGLVMQLLSEGLREALGAAARSVVILKLVGPL